MSRAPLDEALARTQDKAFATLQAQAALKGFQAVRTAAGDFVVERWGMTKALRDLGELRAWLQQVGALG